MSNILVLVSFLLMPILEAQQRSVSGNNGIVVSVSEYASKAGIEILKKGGNAVDAAVTTALVLAVTYPQAGNIGGGGFMLIRLATGEAIGIDYREKAPIAADERMFLNADGQVDTMLANYGYLVAGIPGTIRGLETAWKKYGVLPWHDLVQPAAELATRGFVVYPPVEQTLAEESRYLRLFPESRKTFFKSDGTPYRVGETLIQADLGKTLSLIADSGASVFYEGRLGKQMVEEVRRHGGIWSNDDLSSYQAVERTPITGTYRDLEIIGMPPPSSGGITVLECLNILECQKLTKGDPASMHILIEAMRRSFFDRMRFQGDADFVEVPVSKLISKRYARTLYQQMDKTKAFSSEEWNESIIIQEENLETTHFSIVDKDGNAVSNTFTLEDNYGSHAVVEGLGFLLNSEMHDFNIRPDVPNYQGGFGGNPNLIAPAKRMLSSMAPTMAVKNGKVILITGSPGGRTIINTVVQMIVNIADFDMTLRQAVDAPRLNHNWLPDEVKVERGRWPEEMLRALRMRGHHIKEVQFLGDAQSIGYDEDKNQFVGEADFRRYGSADAY